MATPTFIGVADGVGGWERHGVDSGLFSKQLCRDIQKIAEADKNKELSLKEILIEAVKQNKNMGSSTAVLARLEGNGELKTTNLGDSGYVIFTANKDTTEIKLTKVFRSKEQ